VVGEDVMGVRAVNVGVGVDERGGQTRDRMQEGVLGAHRDLMCLGGGDVCLNDNFAFGADLTVTTVLC
jgi:hypothetical protein